MFRLNLCVCYRYYQWSLAEVPLPFLIRYSAVFSLLSSSTEAHRNVEPVPAVAVCGTRRSRLRNLTDNKAGVFAEALASSTFSLSGGPVVFYVLKLLCNLSSVLPEASSQIRAY